MALLGSRCKFRLKLRNLIFTGYDKALKSLKFAFHLLDIYFHQFPRSFIAKKRDNESQNYYFDMIYRLLNFFFTQ